MSDSPLPPKKSLREILPKGTTRPPRRVALPNTTPSYEPEEVGATFTEEPQREERPHIYHRERRMPKIPKVLIGIIAVVVILAIAGIASSLFASTTVFITPKQATIRIDESFEAAQGAAAGSLEFGTVSNSITESVTVPATGETEVNEKAKGQITIFNNFSAEPQKLVANTRFETKDGKIYRISEAVTVPGQKVEAGKSVPGSIVATITADQAGPSYNIGLTDFTIPGFKNTPRFEKINARSKTPMEGGASGTVRGISTSDREKAETELRSKLEARADDSSSLQIPDGHVLFEDGLFTSYEFETKPAVNPNEVQVIGKLVYTGILFNSEDMARYLAARYIPDYHDEAVRVEKLDTLKFSLENKEDIDPTAVTSIDFALEGEARIIWILDEMAFKTAIAGTDKGNFTTLVGDFPAIESARLKSTPPWAGSLPENIEKIKVEQAISAEAEI